MENKSFLEEMSVVVAALTRVQELILMQKELGGR